ncbi:MAG: lipoprotein-releasing ABC transporter permease subunit [Proteobacteria bacterium]|nr:lipoprotein-releasing ABC transporter permease subunit [Pseudomonadota bacterium]
MFYPLPLYVGLRYVRARSHRFFVSFITWTSLVGVCLGVAALIVILSVMNGFASELRDRLLSLNAQVRVSLPAQAQGEVAEPDWSALAARAAAVPGVVQVARYAQVQALAVRQPEMLPVLLRGIDPDEAASRAELGRALIQGRLADLQPGSDRVIVGEVIAQQLGLAPGDPLTLLIPTVDPSGTPAPKLREFVVAGVFEAGLQDHDATLVFADLSDVRALSATSSAGEGLQLRLQDVMAAPEIAATLRSRLPAGLTVSDWTADNASYFRAIRIEKTMMSLILLLIVAVAAFNIVAMLVMVVTDKRTDIAIVRTFGAAPRQVAGVFMTQGLIIGWLGVGLGLLLGLTLAFNVRSIVPFLERTLGFHIMDPDVYYVVAIPSEIHWGQVALIAVAALLLTAAATLYPSLRAARVAPAEALRYE